MVELASGVDSLYLSSRPNISEELFNQLKLQSQSARDTDEDSIPFEIGEETFQVLNHSWQKYAVCLRHEHGLIGFTNSKKLPGIRVQIYSEFIHSVGVNVALAWFTTILSLAGSAVEWTVSRIDLFMDIQGWDLAIVERSRFICRATQFGMDGEDSKFTGYRFGKRKTGTVIARIYNKTEEIKASSKDWMKLFWGSRWVPSEDVWRIEFEIHSQFLREVGLVPASQVLESIGDLWATHTNVWLTHRKEGEDSNSSRWQISEEWKFVRGCSFVSDLVPLKRIRQVKRLHHLNSIMAGLKGYVTSACAHSEAVSLSECMEFIKSCLEDYDRKSRTSFLETLQNKRAWLNSL